MMSHTPHRACYEAEEDGSGSEVPAAALQVEIIGKFLYLIIYQNDARIMIDRIVVIIPDSEFKIENLFLVRN